MKRVEDYLLNYVARFLYLYQMTESRDTGMNSLYDNIIIIILSIYNTFMINRFVCAQD